MQEETPPEREEALLSQVHLEGKDQNLNKAPLGTKRFSL
jgi:hypothetical protein